MEQLNKYLDRAMLFIRSRRSSVSDPGFTWKMILAVAGFAMLGIVGGALIVYRWALAEEDRPVATRGRMDMVSAAKMDAVIEHYRTKRQIFEALRVSAPAAPSLGRGVSAVIPSTEAEATTTDPDSRR